MKKFLYILPVISAIFLSSCKEEQQSAAPQAMPVQAVKIESKPVELSFEYPARARGYKETEVRSRVGGILLKRNYIEGTKVNEGDILFLIDPEPYKAALHQAQGQLAQFEAQLKAAETQWERINKLYKERVVSEKSRDDALASMDSLKANVETAKAEVDSAQLNLDYTTVTAPISGITSLESLSEGSLVVANSSTLTSITQFDPIYIMFSFSDTELFKLKTMVEQEIMKQPAKGEGGAEIKFPDGSIYEHKGAVNFINPTIDEKTGTVMLRAVFPNPDNKIMPQQFVRLILNGLNIPDAVTLPKEAVMQGAEGTFVYTVTEEGKVAATPVETGFTANNGEWIIEKGLKTGDIVITDSLLKIKIGMPVTTQFHN